MGPYTFFFVGKRDEVYKKNPELPPKDIMRRIAKMWQATSEEERQPYNELYEKDFERYNRQMDEYEAEGVFYDEEGQEVKYRNSARAKRYMAVMESKKRKAMPVKEEKRKGMRK